MGYLCVSLDTPASVRRSDEAGGAGGLDVWREWIATKKKPNFLAEFNGQISEVLDHLIAQGYTNPERVLAMGGSLGAFVAFHYAASDSRVKSVIGSMPLTDLARMTEFKGMENDPVTKSLAAIHLAKKLADRNLLVIVGDDDGRIGTQHAIAFAKRVDSEATKSNVELHVLPARGHVEPKGTHALTKAWLEKLNARSKSAANSERRPR